MVLLLDSNVNTRSNIFPLVVICRMPCVHVVLQPAGVAIPFSTVGTGKQLLLIFPAAIAARDVMNYWDAHQPVHVRRGHQGCRESWRHHLVQILKLQNIMITGFAKIFPKRSQPRILEVKSLVPWVPHTLGGFS